MLFLDWYYYWLVGLLSTYPSTELSMRFTFLEPGQTLTRITCLWSLTKVKLKWILFGFRYEPGHQDPHKIQVGFGYSNSTQEPISCLLHTHLPIPRIDGDIMLRGISGTWSLWVATMSTSRVVYFYIQSWLIARMIERSYCRLNLRVGKKPTPVW